MGNCCKCASTKNSKRGGEEDEGEFTNLDGIDNKNNRKNSNNKKDGSSSKSKSDSKANVPPSSRSEEVHFEYDENTQRLVPIIKSHRKRAATTGASTSRSENDDANSITSDASKKSGALKKKKLSAKRGLGGSVRVPGGSAGSVSDNVSDAGSRQTGDGGRDEESLVDCMSNASFDIPLDEHTMMRFEDSRFNNNNSGVGNTGLTPRQPSTSREDGNNDSNNNNNGNLQEQQQGGEDDDDDDDVEFTLEDLEELEEISRSEIYAAFMVAVQMLRFGMKRITPTVHYMLDSHLNHHHHQHQNNTNKPSSSTSEGGENTQQQQQQTKPTTDAGGNGAVTTTPASVMSPASPGYESSSEFIPSTTTVIQMMKMKQPATKKKKKAKKTVSGDATATATTTDESNNKTSTKKTRNGNDDDDNDNDDDVKKQQQNAGEKDEEEEEEDEAEMPVPGGGIAHKPHRVQLLELDARSIPHDGGKVKSDFLDSRWDFFNSAAGLSEVSARSLSQGKALYGFKCFTGENMTPDDIRLLSPFSNLSSFPNEVEDNNVPHIDFTDKKQLKKYTIIISKAMYLLPGLAKEDISPEYWASREYCEACIAQVSKFEDCTEPSTFRMHKILVRFIFSLVVQFKITEIKDPAILRSLATVDGFVPCKALLYERTKRDKTKVDMTVKVKSVLLFQEVPGGMLVSNVAAVYNSSIPGIIAAIVNNFGGNGASETEEVASRTRKHIWNKFVQPRLDAAAAAAAKKK